MNTVMTIREEQQITIDINRFFKMPIPLQRRGIQLILNYLYKEKPASLSAIHIDQVFSIDSVMQHPSGTLRLSQWVKSYSILSAMSFSIQVEKPLSFHFELMEPGDD